MLFKGLIIARYEVDSLLGSGGMAEVWRARHTVLGAQRALKVLSGQASPAALLGEGRIQARLDHPNVLPVLDVLTHEGVPVLVMPLVEGPSLREHLGSGPLPMDQAVGVFLGILAGVEAAHDKGVIHRDLKPANVLLQQRGAQLLPKVADFGIAALTGAVDAPRWGTTDYAPPEPGVGPSVDYWALGVVLYELLVGARPKDGDLSAAPPELSGLIQALLHPDPQGRLRDAQRVRELITASGVEPRPLRPRPRAAAALGPETQPTGPGLEASAPVSAALPHVLDSFFGRSQELAGLELLLQTPGLVTLTGPGGVGKTRLSIHLGRQISGAFPGGVWFVDLSEATTAEQAQSALASVLSVPISGKDPGGRLDQALSGRGRMLLILDNFEQLVEAAAPTLSRWVRAAPQASFLVSSRAATRIRGERLLPLDVLHLADAQALFLARARQASPDFEAPDAEIQALVQSLDCLPLAIELAAARSRTMSPGVLQERISDRFRLLVSRDRERDPRQRTLQATLDWSWGLLDPGQQSALAQLSVFEGGFDLDAAQAVVELEEGWIEDLLEDLVDRSLVRVKRERGQEPRLGLLMSVQAYGAMRLEELGRAQATRLRHARYYAAQAPPSQVFSSSQGAAYQAAGWAEMGNLRAALQAALSARSAPEAGALAKWIWLLTRSVGPFPPLEEPFRRVHALDPDDAALGLPLLRLLPRLGAEAEQRALAERLIAKVPKGSMLHCRLLQAKGTAFWDSSEPGRARAPLREALLIARAHQDLHMEALLLQDLALVANTLGAEEVYLTRTKRAIALYQQLGAVEQEGFCWISLGVAASGEEAVRYYTKALSLFEASNSRRGRSFALQNLALEAFLAGELGLAEQRIEHAIRLFRLLGDRKNEGRRGKFLARIQMKRGHLDRAEEALSQGAAVLSELGDGVGLALLKLGRAELCVARGELPQAQAWIARAVQELGGHRAADDEVARIQALLDQARAG